MSTCMHPYDMAKQVGKLAKAVEGLCVALGPAVKDSINNTMVWGRCTRLAQRDPGLEKGAWFLSKSSPHNLTKRETCFLKT